MRVLALILMVGGVIGAQFGARAGQKISGERLRLLLGLLVLAVGIRFALDLTLRPDDLYHVPDAGGRHMRRRTLAAGGCARNRCSRAGRRPRPSGWSRRCPITA